MSTSRAVIVALLFALPRIAHAQYVEVRPGARVRIEAPGVLARSYVATVIARSADSITLASPESAPLTLPMARISRLEISRGSSRADGALLGTAWGAGIGAALGALMSPSVNSCSQCSNRVGAGEVVAQMVIGGVVWGAGIGAILGRERWERFDVTPRITIASQGQIGLAVQLPR